VRGDLNSDGLVFVTRCGQPPCPDTVASLMTKLTAQASGSKHTRTAVTRSKAALGGVRCARSG